MRSIAAGEFKAKCLALLDEVARTRERLVITKRGRPVAFVQPYETGPGEEENPLKGSILREADLVSPLEDEWEAAR